jgi:hypothetical protein
MIPGLIPIVYCYGKSCRTHLRKLGYIRAVATRYEKSDKNQFAAVKLVEVSMNYDLDFAHHPLSRPISCCPANFWQGMEN